MERAGIGVRTTEHPDGRVYIAPEQLSPSYWSFCVPLKATDDASPEKLGVVGANLVQILSGISGIQEITLAQYHLTVTKRPGAVWERLDPCVRRALKDVLGIADTEEAEIIPISQAE